MLKPARRIRELIKSTHWSRKFHLLPMYANGPSNSFGFGAHWLKFRTTDPFLVSLCRKANRMGLGFDWSLTGPEQIKARYYCELAKRIRGKLRRYERFV